MLKDTDVSSAFAVISGQCLQFSSQKLQCPIGRVCSVRDEVHEGPSGPALSTTIELHPSSELGIPLKRNAKLNLAGGSLRVQNEDASGPLAFFKPHNKRDIFGRPGARGGMHRELLDHSRSCQNVGVYVVDPL